jgi:hypothetical protein
MKVKSSVIQDEDIARKVKKHYESPVLKDWGSLQDMTLSVGFSGKSDGGRILFTKTHM